jgi:hypothetical protein
MVRMRSFRPVANWSCTKSIAQTWLEWVASVRPSLSLAFTRRFGVLFRSCNPHCKAYGFASC